MEIKIEIKALLTCKRLSLEAGIAMTGSLLRSACFAGDPVANGGFGGQGAIPTLSVIIRLTLAALSPTRPYHRSPGFVRGFVFVHSNDLAGHLRGPTPMVGQSHPT